MVAYGSMARLVINDGIRSGDVFIPGQLFAFGSIVLHASPTGRLGQVGSFSPDQEIRFGNLEFVTDSRGDLILAGLSALPEGPIDPEVLTSDPAYPITGLAATPDPALSSDPISALDCLGSSSAEHDHEVISDTPGAVRLQVNLEDGQNTDPMNRSLLNGMLDQIQTMGITGGQSSVYDQIGHKTDDREIHAPPVPRLAANTERLDRGLVLASSPPPGADYPGSGFELGSDL